MILVTKRTKEWLLLQNPGSTGKEYRKVIPPVENISQYHESQVLEMSRLPARSKSQYFANEEKLISRKERGGFSRERVVE